MSSSMISSMKFEAVFSGLLGLSVIGGRMGKGGRHLSKVYPSGTPRPERFSDCEPATLSQGLPWCPPRPWLEFGPFNVAEIAYMHLLKSHLTAGVFACLCMAGCHNLAPPEFAHPGRLRDQQNSAHRFDP